MFLLTSPPWWVYSSFVNAKSLTGFDSLLHKRIPPLSGFFVSGIYFICPLFFYGWIFWGAFGLAGLVSSLSTRFIRPLVQQVRERFLTVTKEHKS